MKKSSTESFGAIVSNFCLYMNKAIKGNKHHPKFKSEVQFLRNRKSEVVILDFEESF